MTTEFYDCIKLLILAIFAIIVIKETNNKGGAA